MSVKLIREWLKSELDTAIADASVRVYKYAPPWDEVPGQWVGFGNEDLDQEHLTYETEGITSMLEGACAASIDIRVGTDGDDIAGEADAAMRVLYGHVRTVVDNDPTAGGNAIHVQVRGDRMIHDKGDGTRRSLVTFDLEIMEEELA